MAPRTSWYMGSAVRGACGRALKSHLVPENCKNLTKQYVFWILKKKDHSLFKIVMNSIK